MSEEEIKEQTENEEENQEGAAVFLRKVEVITCDGDIDDNEESNGSADTANSG